MSVIEVDELTDDHVMRSKAMIMQAATATGHGRAAVLGCGRCADIPIEGLLEMFSDIDLVELNERSLAAVEHRYAPNGVAGRALHFHHRDLTGVIAHIERAQKDMLSEGDTPSSLLEKLTRLLATVEPSFWSHPAHMKFDLIVCSAVLTQLQASVRRKVEEIFLDRFPGAAMLLKTDQAWQDTIWVFARRLEESFVAHVDSLLAAGGWVYLSDTVHVCWLKEAGAGRVTTAGAWIATKSADLSDYLLEQHTIKMRDAWQWLRWAQEGEYCGRLYGVQAVLYGR